MSASRRALRLHWCLLACSLTFALWWLTLAIAITNGFGQFDSWYDEQRVLLLIGLCVTAIVCLARPVAAASSAVIVGSLVLALGLLSSWGSTYPVLALIETGLMFGCLLAIAIFIAIFRRYDVLLTKGLPIAALLIAGTQVVAVAGNYVAGIATTGVQPEVWVAGFSNRRFPAHLQALLLPLLPAAILVANSKLYRSAARVVFSLWITCWLASGARGAWLALGCAVIAIAIVGWRNNRRWLKTFGVGLVCGALAFGVLAFLIPAILTAGTNLENRFIDITNPSGRQILWHQAVEMIHAAPWLGEGPMHFAATMNGVGAHPHSFLLQIASEWGLPAAAIIAGVLAWLGFSLFRALRVSPCREESQGSFFRAGVVCSYLAWVAYGLVDGIYVIPTSVMAAIPIIAAAWCVAVPVQPIPNPLGKQVARAVSAFVIGALMLVPFHGLSDRKDREHWYVATYGTEYLNPRFWQQGFIRSADQDWRGLSLVRKASRQ